MKLYTRKGDAGQTDLLGERVSKSDPRIGVLGALDEATSAIGLARAHTESARIGRMLIDCQHDLYQIMAELAFTDDIRPAQYVLRPERVAWLEEETDLLGSEITLAPAFVLPGETIAAATTDVARTVVRRAEREAVILHEGHPTVNRQILRYLNRLSSLLFIVARYLESLDDSGPRPARR
ncbi:MAG: cob(I)yrinic acid a,c-diamide adenosyltransferase [Thermomicrobiales bacterium]